MFKFLIWFELWRHNKREDEKRKEELLQKEQERIDRLGKSSSTVPGPDTDWAPY